MEKSASTKSHFLPIPHLPKYPIVGNLFQVASNTPTQTVMSIADKLGDIGEIFFFKHSIIVLSSFALVKEVCDEQRFDKNLVKGLLEVRDFVGDGLFTAWTSEPNWQKAHNIMLPGMGTRSVKGYFPLMLETAESLLAKWHNIPESKYFNLTDDMTRLTFDTIGLCGFDYRFNSFASEEPHPFIKAMLNSLEDSMERMYLFNFQKTYLRPFKNKRYRQSVDYMNKVVDDIISERKANPEKYTSKADFLSLMLNAVDKETGEKLDDINIRHQILTFLIAGHETTSGLLSFAFYYLMKHPEFLQKAYDEVDEVLGTDIHQPPNYQQVMDLKYIQQVLYEALRLWPTAPAFSVYPKEDTVLAGKYKIRRRQPLVVLLPQFHRDKAVWGENADQFNPENFSSEQVAQRDPDSFKPFGNGQRACIGRQFAMLEATLLMGLVLQRYKLSLPENYQFKIKETLSLKPDNLMVRIAKRQPHERKVFAKPTPTTSTLTATAQPLGQHNTPFWALFGSNMGASEDFAIQLAQQATQLGFRAKVASLDSLVGQMPTEGFLAIVTSTYNGTPPDNAAQFDAWLQTASLPADTLKNLSYTVFGCGNTQWQTFQKFPRFIDEKLEALGAKRLFPRGEADASADFDEAFESWQTGLWHVLQKEFGLQQPSQNTKPSSLFTLQWLGDIAQSEQHLSPKPTIRYGEQPFEVLENRELHNKSDEWASTRSTRHISLALPTGITYQTGDHLGIVAENSSALVQKILQRFQIDANAWVQISQNADVPTHLPLRQPILVSDLLTFFVELQEPATRKQVQQLTDATECPPEKVKLQALCDEDAYKEEVALKNQSVFDLLTTFQACELSFADYLTMLPPLKPRYFSISSSALANPQTCTITVGVLEEPALSGNGIFKGVCSNYLAGLKPGQMVRAYVKDAQSMFRLPTEPTVPMIMIGPGTGYAPFRGFLEERAALHAQGVDLGEALLFFGCRHPEQDYIYREELAKWESKGIVQVLPAFSRLNEQKNYVQHQLWENRTKVWQLIEKGAKIYVCGDAAQMAPAVRATFLQIYQTMQPSSSALEAEQWLTKLSLEHRYLIDVWAS